MQNCLVHNYPTLLSKMSTRVALNFRGILQKNIAGIPAFLHLHVNMDHVTTRQHGFMDCTIFVDCFKRNTNDGYWWCYVSYYALACTIKKLREELSRALIEANKDSNDINEERIGSFNELVKEMTSKTQDVKAFAFKTKAMVLIVLLLSFISSYLVSVILL